MDIAFAAIGGADLEREELARAVGALAGRADFEEVTPGGDAPISLRVLAPWSGERSVWAGVEISGEDGIATLVHAARTIASHLGKPVRAVASGVDRQIRPSCVEISYRAFEIQPDGTSRPLSFAAADEECRVVHDPNPADELGGLFALLLDDEPTAAERAAKVKLKEPGRCFRRKALLDDPRLARLAARILAAKTVSFAPDPSGRVRLKIDSIDGGKQISFVSTDEAETLQRATSAAS